MPSDLVGNFHLLLPVLMYFLFDKGLFLIFSAFVTLVCYIDNERMYSNVEVAPLLTMISVTLMD